MVISKIKNIEFRLGNRTLLVIIKDNNGLQVDSKLFESSAVIKEANMKPPVITCGECVHWQRKRPSHITSLTGNDDGCHPCFIPESCVTCGQNITHGLRYTGKDFSCTNGKKIE